MPLVTVDYFLLCDTELRLLSWAHRNHSKKSSSPPQCHYLMVTYRCCYTTVVLQQLDSKTVLAHIGAFPDKCTIKHPFHTTSIMKSLEFYENYICYVWEKNKFSRYYINNESCMVYYPKWLNYLFSICCK
jgi:hypothetical protein